MSKFEWLVRTGLAVALAGSSLAAAWHMQRTLLPAEGCVSPGVKVLGVAAGEREPVLLFSHQRANALLEHRVRLQHDGTVLVDATLRELGATVDLAALREALASVGRRGTLFDRIDDAQQARRGALAVAVPVRLPADELLERLQTYKLEHDRAPVAARWSFTEHRAQPHENGARVDSHTAVEAIVAAARAGEDSVDLPVVSVPPRATTRAVGAIDRSKLVGRWETNYGYVGDQTGRAQNIQRAVAGIAGVALMPNEEISFNTLVGPRSTGNGFARAGEIYKGELRMGVGGGTCQVASTLHAAAFLGGLDITERSPHSRPSGYIPMGLDATVAYPHVDFRLRNPFAFPILVHAVADEGRLTIALYGAEEPSAVEWETQTIAIKPYPRKVREVTYLEEGKLVRKQAGKQGASVRRFRRVQFASGTAVVERSVDHYPPTTEIYLVPSGTDPTELPPLPGTT